MSQADAATQAAEGQALKDGLARFAKGSLTGSLEV